jgi:hypothetical protein
MTAPATAKRFPSPDPKAIRHGPMGIARAGKCAVCGAGFKQPTNGRPRILCRKAKCQNIRHAQQQKSYRAPIWTEADLAEAAAVWGSCYCRANRGHRFQQEFPPLPRCALCWKGPITDGQALWLLRVKRGCPLPTPTNEERLTDAERFMGRPASDPHARKPRTAQDAPGTANGAGPMLTHPSGTLAAPEASQGPSAPDLEAEPCP